MTNKKFIWALPALALAGLIALPGAASAATCSFTADLQVGSVSEEVRCLQQYLNGEGFVVAATGVGSKGSETNQFQTGTKAAVIKWQTANSLPATGFFGPASRAKYASLTGTSAPAPAPTPSPAPTPTPAPAPTPSTAMSAARATLLTAQKDLKAATDDLDDSEVKKSVQEDAQEKIDNANAAMLKALYAFLNESYSSAEDYADEASKEADAAIAVLEDEDSDDEDSELTFAEAVIFNNETVVKLEYDGDEIVFTTSSDDEDDIIDDILDEVDSRNLTAGDVEDELEIDEEDRNSRASDKEFDSADADESDADDAIDDADDAIDEAKDEIDDADADGDDVNEANDLLDDAEDALDDARDAFDDEDWEDAVELADEAKELAEDAIDAL